MTDIQRPTTRAINTHKIDKAAGGNAELKEILQNLAQTVTQQQQVTSTATKSAPSQAGATVALVGTVYVIEITNPGGLTPVSALQQAQGKTLAGDASTTNLVPVFHQIRAATSPKFDVPSNVRTFGGAAGSTQTYWAITDLDSGHWFFQTRSSFDGLNWNIWKNANAGDSITSNPDSVAEFPVTNGVFAAFQLPGKQLVAFGAGTCHDQDVFTLPLGLFTSSLLAIATPNGFTETGNDMHGIRKGTVDIVPPVGAPPTTLPTSYPAVVSMNFGDGSGHTWPGVADWFAFAYDPNGSNVSAPSVAGGKWAVLTLSGGARIAVGQGVTFGSAPVSIPAGFSTARMLSIATPVSYNDTGHQAHGVRQCDIAPASSSTFVVTLLYGDGSGNTWDGNSAWFVVLYDAGLSVVSSGGHNYLVLTTPGGSKIAIGAGSQASGTSITLPAGFTPSKSLSVASPDGYNDTGHPAHGILNCFLSGLGLTLTYTDGSGNQWDGNMNWFTFAWQ